MGQKHKGMIKPGERRGISTEFKKGQIPNNKLPVGSLTVRQPRYDSERAWIKIAAPNEWKLYAEWVWINEAGPIPKGFIIHHLDGDTLNDNISNLACMKRSGHVNVHRSQLIEARRTTILPIKDITCSFCGGIFKGKYQRTDSICPRCRRIKRSEQQRYYRKRLRSAS